jgi:hypothetical protein
MNLILTGGIIMSITSINFGSDVNRDVKTLRDNIEKVAVRESSLDNMNEDKDPRFGEIDYMKRHDDIVTDSVVMSYSPYTTAPFMNGLKKLDVTKTSGTLFRAVYEKTNDGKEEMYMRRIDPRSFVGLGETFILEEKAIIQGGKVISYTKTSEPIK